MPAAPSTRVHIQDHILYVRNLPYKLASQEMYDLFGKYGDIRQIRVGNEKETRGTGYVVYAKAGDAKRAQGELNGYCMSSRYLIVLPFQAGKVKRAERASSSGGAAPSGSHPHQREAKKPKVSEGPAPPVVQFPGGNGVAPKKPTDQRRTGGRGRRGKPRRINHLIDYCVYYL